MDNLQNNKKTENNYIGHTALFDKKHLQNKTTYDFAIKKTEKLVTALYMVTDCMEADDAIKNKLRLLGIELLSRTHRLPNATSLDQSIVGAEALNRIHEIFSLVEIASTLGYISDMNSIILKKEFTLLSEELDLRQSSQSVALSDDLFTVERAVAQTPMSIKDISMPTDKRTPYMSFKNNPVVYPMPPVKRLPAEESNTMNRNDRTQKILALIKDKNTASSGAELGVSIKDISGSFVGCSEKTIQRELNSLISKGHIKKIGAKRWSRYLMA